MIKFTDMSLSSRVWIYQSTREFSENEIGLIKQKSEDFISDWTSHGKTMRACIEIFHKRFIIVCVDETSISASGCGIDKSVKFIQKLEKEFNTSLLNRLNVAYRQPSLNNEVGEIITCHISELKSLLKLSEGKMGIIVFNNLVNTKEALEKSWEVPLEKF